MFFVVTSAVHEVSRQYNYPTTGSSTAIYEWFCILARRLKPNTVSLQTTVAASHSLRVNYSEVSKRSVRTVRFVSDHYHIITESELRRILHRSMFCGINSAHRQSCKQSIRATCSSRCRSLKQRSGNECTVDETGQL